MIGGKIVKSCLNFGTLACDEEIIDGRSQELVEKL